jgi:mRNA-degrading endonuclease RelE of RelBE toxin-antitoxin system
MPFEIEFTFEAEKDLIQIKPFYRSQIFDAVEALLRHKPMQVSRARIKRLRLLDSPAYRLRVGDYRVFYDVDAAEKLVTVLRILSKEAALNYLQGR